MQTNFHAQLKSLMAQAIGTLRHQIESKGQPSQFDAEIKVIAVKGEHYTAAPTYSRIAEVCQNGVINQYGDEYTWSEVNPETLLKLIDEVCTS